MKATVYSLEEQGGLQARDGLEDLMFVLCSLRLRVSDGREAREVFVLRQGRGRGLES